ncbi:ABC transporter permease [Ureibacillus manganicus]|uniref:D-ala-D-ala transporter subunit n=1 Tax=Ureibacillus manganicus DSM 26584 TaxID=1384049 RepID=A0A0A3I2G1_9BACL|nr:ABC transporter permease [Ureibacillus manganicus]KGR79016.1 D-ala-D-ala transporter subunit [Ureibacillus manganicus DSM 26584]
MSAETVTNEVAKGSNSRFDYKRAWYKLKKSKLSLVGLFIVVGVIFMAIFAPWIVPYPADATGATIAFDKMNQPPSLEHFFGTDEIGRDIFSRVVYGARISLMLGILVLAIAIGIGVPLGLIAGIWGGKIGALIMRITDIFLAIPSLVLALAVAAILEPTLINIMIAISFGWWPWFTRLVYGEVLSLKDEQFVLASEGLGASKWRIAFIEVLPNCTSTIIVKATLDMGFVILTGASLGFLGLGAQPPTPEWGTMIAEGRVYLPEMWWQATFPGFAILVTVLGFNLLGDGLRDVFDVRLDGE